MSDSTIRCCCGCCGGLSWLEDRWLEHHVACVWLRFQWQSQYACAEAVALAIQAKARVQRACDSVGLHYVTASHSTEQHSAAERRAPSVSPGTH